MALSRRNAARRLERIQETLRHTNFCYEGHKHDSLCDPTLVETRVEPVGDPTVRNHRFFMEAHNQEGWLAWQLTRPLTIEVDGKRKGRRKRPSRATAPVQSAPVKKRR